MIRVNILGSGWLMHVLNPMWPLGMYWPSGSFQAFLRCFSDVSYLAWHLSLFEWVCHNIDLIKFHVWSCIIYHFLVQSFLVSLQCVLMLSFESHLHLLVSVSYQRCELT